MSFPDLLPRTVKDWFTVPQVAGIWLRQLVLFEFERSAFPVPSSRRSLGESIGFFGGIGKRASYSTFGTEPQRTWLGQDCYACLEYLLGQHCATDDSAVIKSGLESVQRILAKHYVHRNQAELVELNDKGGFCEAEFTNLGLKKVPVSDDFVRRFPKLLVGGIWYITDVTYEVAEDPKASPWQIDTLKPIQVAAGGGCEKRPRFWRWAIQSGLVSLAKKYS